MSEYDESELDEMEEDDADPEAAHRKPRRQSKQEAGHGPRELNLTAMVDMMTILLVFLIKNYSSTPESVQLSEIMTPPRSTSKITMEPAVTITVTQKNMLVDDKPVTNINPSNWSIVDENPSNKNPNINALAERLEKKVADLKAIEQKGGPPFEGKLLIVADQDVTYELLMRILYTAGDSQFSQYKLVVRSIVDNQIMNDG